MIERTSVKTNVEVVQLLPGELPAIRLLTRGRDLTGNQRHHVQQISVRDASLFARLCAEVKRGDPIEATIVTEWTEDDYATYLADFALTAARDAIAGSPVAVGASLGGAE